MNKKRRLTMSITTKQVMEKRLLGNLYSFKVDDMNWHFRKGQNLESLRPFMCNIPILYPFNALQSNGHPALYPNAVRHDSENIMVMEVQY